MNQPIEIKKQLKPGETSDPVTMTQAPLMPGYTWFYVAGAAAYDNNPVEVYKGTERLWPYQQVQATPNPLFFKKPLHAVRARTYEEISGGRALWIAAISLVILVVFQLISWVLQYSKLTSASLVAVPVIFGSIVLTTYLSFKVPKPNTKAFERKELFREGVEAKFEVESNHSFMIYWAVLLFTCVAGTIGLSQLIKPGLSPSIGVSMTLVYFGLLGGIILSMFRVFSIYRENHEILYEGKLGKKMQEYILNNQGILDRHRLTSWYFQALLSGIVAFTLELLYFGSIGFL